MSKLEQIIGGLFFGLLYGFVFYQYVFIGG